MNILVYKNRSERHAHWDKMRRLEREVSNPNLMHVVSMIKLQNMQAGKGKFWRRRGGSSRMSLMSSVSQDSKTVSKYYFKQVSVLLLFLFQGPVG